MTLDRRQIIYSKIFQFMLKNGTTSLPLNIESLCEKVGVDLVPLSQIIQDTGFSNDDIFSIWGNKDGAINCCGDTHRISYNDAKPQGRIRFTMLEELAHMICEHTKDPRFNIFSQEYDEDTYLQYEEEARMGAGMLICNPKFFYSYQDVLTISLLANICDITLPCARTRSDVFHKFKAEITSNPIYSVLPTPLPSAGVKFAI